VRKVSEMAKRNNLKVVIYGHKGNYIETTEDGHRIIKLARCRNVTNSLNLCHESMAGNGDRLDEILRKYGKELTLVSINGADTKNQKYILRLDQGDFNLINFLRTLKGCGYNGPIGLQCFIVPGDQKENLKINMDIWQKILSDL
jgi:sugar phosphate isomerase/epimerase